MFRMVGKGLYVSLFFGSFVVGIGAEAGERAAIADRVIKRSHEVRKLELQASAGSAEAQSWYGRRLLYGTTDRVEEGVGYLINAAAQGNIPAAVALGTYFMRREDIEKGVGYLINAAAKGNVAAQQWLAFYVQTDKSGKVFHYLNQFAAQGHAEAQHALDYFQRRRNATDEERATSSFERTAEHGADFAE